MEGGRTSVKISLNDTISKKYVRFAEQYGNYSYEQCERMKYALKVMLNEGEKVLLLSVIFGMLGEFSEGFSYWRKKMKVKNILILNLLSIALVLNGCGENVSTEEFQVKSTESANSEVIKKKETEVMGEFCHGVNWLDVAQKHVLYYKGGEMKIPYKMKGSGIGTSAGFLIFLDGEPQPYKIDGEEEEYKYMHVLTGEEEEEKTFTIAFTPVKGKKGEQSKIKIVSLVNPTFMPDMEETFAYGNNHSTLENSYDLEFKENADKMMENKDSRKIIQNSSQQEEDIDKDLETKLEEYQLGDLDLENRVTSYIEYNNDPETFGVSNLDITGIDKLHVTYVMMGHPKAVYKVNFYLNHQLVTLKNASGYTITLKKGKQVKIEFDLDVSEIEEGSFYAVEVPVNEDDYPDDEQIGTNKEDTVYLYRGDK